MGDKKAEAVQSGAATPNPASIKIYLIVAVSWWAVAMFATTIRVDSELWRPIFDIFFAQALLMERMVPHGPRALIRLLWLLLYILLFLAMWLVVERATKRDPSHCFRRALVGSLLIQASLFGLGLGLAPE